MLLKLAIVWTVVQLVEGKLISPQIMGKNLHIHPITIIFVLLTAGKLFGVVGIILAIRGMRSSKWSRPICLIGSKCARIYMKKKK